VLSLVVALLLVAPTERPFAEERLLLDRRLETLRRMLPDGPVAAADIAHVRDLAAEAQLGGVEIKGGAPEETGTRGVIAYDLEALGGFEEIERFFSRLALSHRLVDVASLTLTTNPEHMIRVTATLRFPFWPAAAPLPPPPERSGGQPRGVPRPTLDAYRRDQARALAKSAAIASWRRARRNPRLFLSELAAVVRERPVVLAYAALDDGSFTTRGLAIGEGTIRNLEVRFERGFFRMSEFLVAKQGACHRFEAHGTSPVAGPDAELPVPLEDPFLQDDAPCRVDRDPPPRVVVRGRTPTAKNPGNGPLTLRLRGLDFADVFQALSLVSGAGFIVDADVVGQVDLDVTRQTLDEILELVRQETGIEVASSGRLRRVSRSGPPSPATMPRGGEPASFALKRADVRELLAALTDIDASLAALGPPGFLGRLSVWASAVPLLELRGAVLDAAGLVERVEDERRILDRATGTGEAPVPVAGRGREPRLRLGPEELAVLEFELAGVASNGDGWLAFAYSPTGQLHAYRPGDRLADAIIRSVQSTDAVLETSEGPLRVELQAPSD
jgi:hypothetical protein